MHVSIYTQVPGDKVKETHKKASQGYREALPQGSKFPAVSTRMPHPKALLL